MKGVLVERSDCRKEDGKGEAAEGWSFFLECVRSLGNWKVSPPILPGPQKQLRALHEHTHPVQRPQECQCDVVLLVSSAHQGHPMLSNQRCPSC